MDLRQLIHVFAERAWIILSVFVLVTLLVVGYVQRLPRIFAATATLQVEQQEQKILKFERVIQEDLRSTETLRTILQTLKTRALMERVAETTKVGENPKFGGSQKLSPNQAAAWLGGIVSARLRAGTRLIDVTVEHTDPEVAALLANAVTRDFIRLGFEQDTSASDLAAENLKREADRMKAKLHESELALQNYMAASKSVSLQERLDIVVPKLKELSSKVNEGRYTVIRQEGENARLKEAGTNIAALLAVGLVANDPTVVGLQLNLSKLESEFATLRQRYRSEHPKYLQMAFQVAELKAALVEVVIRAKQSAEAAHAALLASQEKLEAALKDQEQAALELNKQAIQYGVLEREVAGDRTMYEAVLSRLKEMSLTKDLANYKVRIVETALQPNYAIKPQKTKLVMAGMILGLLAGLGLAFLVNSLDNTFKTVDQVEEMTGQPVIATIPQVRGLDELESKLVVEETSNSGEAEAFRSLRAALSMLGRSEDRRVFLFTSALPQEGKTFCSINFALSLAQQGLRTLIIDCDLRRPNVEKSLFGGRQAHPGVTDYLTGKRGLDEVVRNARPNLFYVGTGSHAPNPSELLAQGRFERLLEEAGKVYDRIVVDSAPIQAVSDTLLVLPGVQTVCLTVRSGKTPRKAAMRALQTLKNCDAPLAGVILNVMKRRRGGGYYYNYYDYSYHSAYGADQSEAESNGKQSKDGSKSVTA
jgi:capsular exopolysaccharide synthesis family protein